MKRASDTPMEDATPLEMPPPPVQQQQPQAQEQDTHIQLPPANPEVAEQPPVLPAELKPPVVVEEALIVAPPLPQPPPPPPVVAQTQPVPLPMQLQPIQPIQPHPPQSLQPLPPPQPPPITSIHQLAMQPTQVAPAPTPPPLNPVVPQPPPLHIPPTQLPLPIQPQQPPAHLLGQSSVPSIPPQVIRPNPPSPYQAPPPTAPSPASAAAAGPRQVKFENALDFLDQVKLQFAKQPRVYNQFLDIMKDFKAQYIDTPGVIARVTELFKGHKHLILGFNTFLPPGYKIELPEEEKSVGTPPPPPVATPPAPVTQAGATTPRKQPEFDHARNYVKKIKTRFNTQPHVYKAFLEILHTYHKEQHTIKDVYDQVAKLFAQHPDLLEEFTQFLPDPLAANSMPGAGAPVPSPAPAHPTSRSTKSSRPIRYPANKSKQAAPVPSPSGEKEAIRPERPAPMQLERRATKRPARGRADENPPKRPAYDPEEREKEKEQREKERERLAPDGNYEELDFFFRVKNTLSNKPVYHEFLKCINLFSQEIISRVELVLLVKDLLSREPELFDWFKTFIGFDDHALELLEKKEAMAEENRQQPLFEIDFTQCKRHGSSYRALPKSYVGVKCSGRTELCNSVLNDQWVSVPTGSEDFTFKNMRKNQYEEVLFKCEDERYELDLVIELNCSTIRALEPICAEVEKLTEEEANNYKLKTPLDVLHVRSIERLYGDKGQEVIEGIYANPATAIPIIVKRLKQKDQEWTKSRREWNKVWHEITEKNYHKSLDHQSFFFKQQEKKNLSPKVLLAEIKQQYAERLREKEQEKEAAANKERRSLRSKEKDGKADSKAQETIFPKYHLRYSMENTAIFQDIADLVLFAADKTLSKIDNDKIDTFLKHFLNMFFKFDQTQPAEAAPNQTKESVQTPPEAPAAASEDIKIEPMDTEGKEADGASAPKPAEPSKTPTLGVKPVEENVLEEKRTKQVFFGNNTFYIFFRLHQILYERLAKARELAKISQKVKWNAKPARPAPRANGDVSGPPSPYNNNNNSTPSVASPSTPTPANSAGTPATIPATVTSTPPPAAAEEKKDRYQSFLEKLYSLLAGATDQTHYEDECRGLLGISSYVLFTLDKLVVQLTRQLQALLTSENCSKLLSLYSYESQRPTGVVESVYHMSCAEFLNEERLFLFEFEQQPRPGRFTIQLMDSTTQGVPKFVEFSFEPNKYSEYVTSFTRDFSSKVDPRKHHVFLLRNQKLNRDNESILTGVTNENNLECRICLSTYRLFYVEDTEDFFYRPKACRTYPSAAPSSSHPSGPRPKRGITQVLEKLSANLPPATTGSNTTTGAQ